MRRDPVMCHPAAPRPHGLLLLLFLATAGCGEAPPPQPPEDAPARLAVPADPAEALAWVRAAALDPEGALRERLASWPSDPGPFFDAEETQVVFTWRLRLALQDGDVEEALAQRERLEARFEGHGVSPQGRGLTPEMIRWGIFEEALLQARLRMDGAEASPKAARSALHVARALFEQAEVPEGEDLARLEAAETWVGLEGIEQLTGRAELDLAHGPSLAASHAKPPAGAHAWVLAIADDFALGEETFAGPLERWQKEGADIGLRVAVIPRFTGQVRMGIRRVPVMDPVRERASVRERIASRGLGLADEMEDGPFRLADRPPEERDGLGERIADVLGLPPQHAAVLVVDARGRVVGRMDGMGLDLRALDPVVQKLVSR